MQKDPSTAYALSMLGLCGIHGVHRFYLDMIPTGVVWLLTGGLCCVGTCVDWCIMGDLVMQANARAPQQNLIVTQPVYVQQPQYISPMQNQVMVVGYQQPQMQPQMMVVSQPQTVQMTMAPMPMPMPMQMPQQPGNF